MLLICNYYNRKKRRHGGSQGTIYTSVQITKKTFFAENCVAIYIVQQLSP